jgi:hypothetical protein
MLHVTIPQRHQHPSPALKHHAKQLLLSILQPKRYARRKPARLLSSARAFTFVNKKPPPPTLFSAQKTAKSALDSYKNAYLCGGRRLHPRGQKQGRGSRNGLSKRCFRCTCCSCRSCQIVLNIIKISNKSSFVQTLFIIFAVFNHIEHDHIIEQAKKNEGK